MAGGFLILLFVLPFIYQYISVSFPIKKKKENNRVVLQQDWKVKSGKITSYTLYSLWVMDARLSSSMMFTGGSACIKIYSLLYCFLQRRLDSQVIWFGVKFEVFDPQASSKSLFFFRLGCHMGDKLYNRLAHEMGMVLVVGVAFGSIVGSNHTLIHCEFGLWLIVLVLFVWYLVMLLWLMKDLLLGGGRELMVSEGYVNHDIERVVKEILAEPE